MFIDTHCHLDFDDYKGDLDEVIARAKEHNVGCIVNIGSSIDGSRRSVELAQKYSSIYASVGVHPHDAKDTADSDIEELEKLANDDKVVAIGEIGLDYFKNLSPQDAQERVFRNLLALSRRLGLPVILHNREAHSETLKILKEELAAPMRGVMHCFSGDAAFLKEALDAGLHISFTANITYKNADALRELVKSAPIERILLETDAPFLAPQSLRGKRNEPSYVVIVAEEIARLKGLSIDDVERITTLNAERLFGIGDANREPVIAYPIRDSLYLNITTACTNECSFCIKYYSDFVKGHNLKLKKEPTPDEIIEAAGEVWKYSEAVFCGYGEPTTRLSMMREVALALRSRGAKSIRLNTNGHGNLIHNRSIVKELGEFIDEVSVSLDVDTKDKYNRICKPQFGPDTYGHVKEFVKECKQHIKKVSVTFLDMAEVDLAACERIARDELGVPFRIRKLGIVG